MRDAYSPITAQAVIPSLRLIAEATGEPKDLSVLAGALRRVDPGEATTLLHLAYDQATTSGDHRLASGVVGDLVTLLRHQGRLREALTLTNQKMEHTRQARLGPWTQLGDQAQRLQILGRLGQHEQILTDLPALCARMAELPDQPADDEIINPWNVQESIVNTGYCSARVLERWQQALDLNNEHARIKQCRGASPHETARTRFNNCVPLLGLGRLDEAEHVLRDCQATSETVGDISMLGTVFGAKADLEDHRGHHQDAAEFQRSALRLQYVHPDPGEIAVAHYNLANYLSRGTEYSAEQRAHRLAAALLYHFTGDTYYLTDTLRVLADELSGNTHTPDAPVLPTTLPEVIGLVDEGDGVRFGDLAAALCSDPDTADQALTDLLATATTLPDQPAEHTVDHHLSEWEPVIAAVAAAATTGHTPTELAGGLDRLGDSTDWAALVAALRRVLAGDRDREQLLDGLDEVGTAILTATLDRLSTDHGQDP